MTKIIETVAAESGQTDDRAGNPVSSSAPPKKGTTKGARFDKADPYPTLPRRSLIRDLKPGEAA